MTMVYLISGMFNLFIGLWCVGDVVLDHKETFNALCGIGSFVFAAIMFHIYIITILKK